MDDKDTKPTGKTEEELSNDIKQLRAEIAQDAREWKRLSS